MDGWMDGWMDGGVGKWVGGWMDGVSAPGSCYKLLFAIKGPLHILVFPNHFANFIFYTNPDRGR